MMDQPTSSSKHGAAQDALSIGAEIETIGRDRFR